MKNIYLFFHGGSGNHGCEALVRSTAELFDEHKLKLVSHQITEDIEYHIDDLCDVFAADIKKTPQKFSLDFLRAYYALKIKGDYETMDNIATSCALGIKKGDVALHIGGDNYFPGYKSLNRIAHWQDIFLHRKAKTVLWGCSVEPESLDNPGIVADLKRYSLITARETVTYDALKKINSNTILVSDSAFLLKKKELPLPAGLNGKDFVGINTSPLIESNEKSSGTTRKNYDALIDYILEQTDMSILFIPHVYWRFNDDRTILQEFYDKYAHTGRVFQITGGNCEELKGYIARCRFFVGARTHATIAAYSTGVPTLVVGYSTKARGIARDLFGTEENYVLPVQSLQQPDELTKAFAWLLAHEDKIKTRLANVLPEYINRVYTGRDAVLKLLK